MGNWKARINSIRNHEKRPTRGNKTHKKYKEKSSKRTHFEDSMNCTLQLIKVQEIYFEIRKKKEIFFSKVKSSLKIGSSKHN
jgi:hypothetical protein